MRRRNDTRTPARARAATPRLEGLEGRLLLYSTTGGSWSRPERVTFSFAPDGTSVGGTPSALFATFNPRFATVTWQDQFRKAAAIWEQVADINLAQVSDNGAAMGTGGNQQGDSRFGDIRIGAVGLGSSLLAVAFLPPPQNGGTSAGDILMNTNINWQINNDYDLLTVAIHEFGHSLGMDHSTISSAVLYAYYNATKQSLTADDTSGIQSIYNTRQPDRFDLAASNQTLATATDINPAFNTSGQLAILDVDITNSQDYDFYRITVPSATNGTLSATVQSSNLSLLSPRVQVYNASGTSLAAATSVGAYGATVTATVTGVSAGQTYYIRASNANGGATGSGAYGLQVIVGSATLPPLAPPNTVVAEQPDQGGGGIGVKASMTILDYNDVVHDVDDIDVPVKFRIGTLSGYAHTSEIEPDRPLGVKPDRPVTRPGLPTFEPTLYVVAPTSPSGLIDATIASVDGLGRVPIKPKRPGLFSRV